MTKPLALFTVVFLAAACEPGSEAAGCASDLDCPLECSCDLPSGICRANEGEVCEVITCLAPGNCPDGMYCSDEREVPGLCVRACTDKTPGDGTEGADCRFDSDCASGACDNALKESNCFCLRPQGGTGGTGGGGGTGGSIGCPVVDVAPGTVPMEGACDDDADCADGIDCTECVCLASQVASCADPLEVALRVTDAAAQCETVFEDTTGTYREIEVAQQQVHVGYTTLHALSLVRWDPAVQALDDPQYDESVVGPVMLDLFPGTPYGVAVEVTDTCNPPRTAEDVLIVVSSDAVCE